MSDELDDKLKFVVPIEEPTVESTDPPPDNVRRIDFSPIGLSSGRVAQYCTHSHSIVDGHARKVRCKACGVDLDPIEVLAKLARRADAFLWTVKEERRIKERITELKKEEARIKARVKTARKRLGDDE